MIGIESTMYNINHLLQSLCENLPYIMTAQLKNNCSYTLNIKNFESHT